MLITVYVDFNKGRYKNTYSNITRFCHFSTPDSVYGNLIKTSNHVIIPSFNCIEPLHDAIKRETIIINNSFAE